MNSVISFGILGCGSISAVHAGALQSLPEAQLIGVADAVEERAIAAAQKYGVRSYCDYAEMLSDPAIDAICICTPSGCHAEDAIKALRAVELITSLYARSKQDRQ